MKTISVRLPDQLDVRLTKTARLRGVAKSSLIRDAVDAYLQRIDASSFAARAADLAGCIAGPADLAGIDERMAGYGQ